MGYRASWGVCTFAKDASEWGIQGARNDMCGLHNGTPLQYSCLENPMDGGAWKVAVHGVSKSQTRLSNFTFTFHFHALEKEMATHLCSCLENLRDGGAWWAAVCGVTQSQTRLKWLSIAYLKSEVSIRMIFSGWSGRCGYFWRACTKYIPIWAHIQNWLEGMALQVWIFKDWTTGLNNQVTHSNHFSTKKIELPFKYQWSWLSLSPDPMTIPNLYTSNSLYLALYFSS